MTKGEELAPTTPTPPPLPQPSGGGGLNEETKITQPRLMFNCSTFVIPIDSGEGDCSFE